MPTHDDTRPPVSPEDEPTHGADIFVPAQDPDTSFADPIGTTDPAAPGMAEPPAHAAESLPSLPDAPSPAPRDQEMPSESLPFAPHTRDADASDAPPPMNAPARGPMGQLSPDVATGSTPVTRHDD